MRVSCEANHLLLRPKCISFVLFSKVCYCFPHINIQTLGEPQPKRVRNVLMMWPMRIYKTTKIRGLKGGERKREKDEMGGGWRHTLGWCVDPQRVVLARMEGLLNVELLIDEGELQVVAFLWTHFEPLAELPLVDLELHFNVLV